jgi:hypothetical protein
MTTTILAHFDGKVIVPNEPVDVPTGTPLRLRIELLSTESHTATEEPSSAIVRLDAGVAQSTAKDRRLDNKA